MSTGDICSQRKGSFTVLPVPWRIQWIAFADFRRQSAGRLQGRPTSPFPSPGSRFRVQPPADISGYVNHRIPQGGNQR